MLFKIGLYSYTGLIYYRKVKTKKILHKLYWKLFNSILGHWFDDSQPVRLVSQSDDPDFAPEFVLRNADKFKQMLIKEWQTILVCLLFAQVKLPCMFIHCFVFLKKCQFFFYTHLFCYKIHLKIRIVLYLGTLSV